MYLTYDIVKTILTHIEFKKILKNSPNIHLGTFHNDVSYVKYILFCVCDSCIYLNL